MAKKTKRPALRRAYLIMRANMEGWTKFPGEAAIKSSASTLLDLKLRMVEHIIAQKVGNRAIDVWGILRENKVASQQRSTLLNELKRVFSSS